MTVLNSKPLMCYSNQSMFWVNLILKTKKPWSIKRRNPGRVYWFQSQNLQQYPRHKYAQQTTKDS